MYHVFPSDNDRLHHLARATKNAVALAWFAEIFLRFEKVGRLCFSWPMLRTLAHKAVRSLLLKHRIITEDEDLNTQRLVRELGKARARGYLTRRELEKICRWKSARAIHLVRANGSAHVRAMTELALQTRSEKRRIEALTALKGVSLPMASAI